MSSNYLCLFRPLAAGMRAQDLTRAILLVLICYQLPLAQFAVQQYRDSCCMVHTVHVLRVGQPRLQAAGQYPKHKLSYFCHAPIVTPGVAVTLLGTEGTPGPEPKSHTSFSRKTFAYIPLIFCPAGAATQVQWRYYRSIMQPRLLLRRLLLQLQTAVVRTLHD